jgi:hypothetical protein
MAVYRPSCGSETKSGIVGWHFGNKTIMVEQLQEDSWAQSVCDVPRREKLYR